MIDPRPAWPKQEQSSRSVLRNTIIDRRDRVFWQCGKPKPSVVRRDPYFVVALDTGNS